MLKHVKGLVFLLLLLLIQNVVYPQESRIDDVTIPIPDTACNIEKYSLISESAYQVDFEIHVSYPDSSVIDFYSTALGNKGWNTCEHDDASWVEYEKSSNNTDRLVRQKLKYFLSKDKKRLILVAIRYYGQLADNPMKSQEWNEDVQHVSVVLYHLPSNDIRKMLSFLSVNCDKVQE